jgi:hypothetical protein
MGLCFTPFKVHHGYPLDSPEVFISGINAFLASLEIAEER